MQWYFKEKIEMDGKFDDSLTGEVAAYMTEHAPQMYRSRRVMLLKSDDPSSIRDLNNWTRPSFSLVIYVIIKIRR